MEFSKFATMVENHGCAKQTTDVEFTCKCKENISVPLYAFSFIPEDHQCEYLGTVAKLSEDNLRRVDDDNRSVKSTSSTNKSVGSSKSVKALRTNTDIRNSRYFICLEDNCKTPVHNQWKSFHTEKNWAGHMSKVKVYYRNLLLFY